MGLGAMIASEAAGRLETADGGPKVGDNTIAVFTNDVTPESVDRIAEGKMIAETTHGFADWGWFGTAFAVQLVCGVETGGDLRYPPAHRLQGQCPAVLSRAGAARDQVGRHPRELQEGRVSRASPAGLSRPAGGSREEPMFRFDQKVIIVTGGSLGIGAAACARVRRGGRPRRHREPAGRGGGSACCDASPTAAGVAVHSRPTWPPRETSVRLVERTLARFGRLDVLVNNAGIHMTGDATETTLADWDRIMAVNVTSAFLCTKHAAEALAETHGAIVNVSSEAGLVGIRNQVAYNVSKAAMIELTKSCAVDFAPRGVRVNCVCPGTTATPLVEELVARAPDPAAARRQWESIRPMNRLGTTNEIASAILYLASEEAGYATGAVLAVDGGYTAQ